jgi:hypothetical protein
MIKIFRDFRQSSTKNLCFFWKPMLWSFFKNYQYLIWAKKPYFRQLFQRKYFSNHNIGPRSLNDHALGLQTYSFTLKCFIIALPNLAKTNLTYASKNWSKNTFSWEMRSIFHKLWSVFHLEKRSRSEPCSVTFVWCKRCASGIIKLFVWHNIAIL